MNQLRCRPTSIPRMRPSLIWAFMLNFALSDLAVNELDHGVSSLRFNFLGEIGIDSAHSMPAVTATHSTSTIARGLAFLVVSMKLATEF